MVTTTRETILAMVPDCKTVNRYMLMADGTIGLVFGIASDCILLQPGYFDGGTLRLGTMVRYSFDKLVKIVNLDDIRNENGNTIVDTAIVHDLNNWPCKVVIEHKGKRVETIGVILTRGKFCVIRHDNPLLRNIEFATTTVRRLLDELGYVKYTDEANYRLASV